ncbi:hypothetical protein CDCA_CDCA01G0146 [Cyanidium caldarium]|uniref:CBM20 domain-containing protein n=1 Tax=Cyanidium caldarium TaxID=2771 RepID=A0AAV9IPX3_CYACA|nr:hypothetical protein CDCA_CDCA01G0146 [Cyanidium caldarium]
MYGNARTYSHGGVDASQRTRVTFVVRCKDVDPGKQEHLFVLGDAVPLGSWSVAHAVPMMREERASTPEPTTSLATATGGGGGDGAGSALALLPGAPHGSRGAPWCATVELDSGTQVDYKYCILVRDPVTGAIDLTQEPRFEPFEGNRVLKVFGVGMRVDDRKFGEPFMATDESRIRVNYGRVFSRFEAPKSESLDCTSDGAVASARNAPLRSGLAATRYAPVVLEQPSCLIIVLYRLPILARRVHNEWVFQWDDDALYLTSVGLRKGLEGKIRVTWVGILNSDEEVPVHEQAHVSNILTSRYGCVPVFLPAETRVKFYQGFCKGVLWPLFHMITEIFEDDTHRTKNFDRSLWHVYCNVNRKFADTVVSLYHEGDLIWIHDYHLLVLPSQLRRKLCGAKIGFFLHTPWPSSEMYRMLPVRDELLRGLLSSTLIGFHLFDYARHFLSACVRLLNLEHESSRGSLAVEYAGRHVMIRVSHIGIDPERFRERLLHPDVKAAIAALRRDLKNRVILAAVDDLDMVKGIALKLLAFEALLASYPGYRDVLVLVQVAIPKVARVKPYVRDEIRALVERINNTYGSGDGGDYTPVLYIERDISFDERVAIYSLADMVFLTPIRDGLNLVPYEYVVSAAENKGQLILSEFTGCSRALSGAVRINPWNREEVAYTIDKVLQNNDEVKRRKHAADLTYVAGHTTADWAVSFLSDLERASEPVVRLTKLGLGFGVGARMLEFEGFQHLTTEQVVKSLRASQQRLFLFDYDGTLTGTDPRHERMAHAWAKPSDTVMQALAQISSNSHNLVVIMSGRSREMLQSAFKGLGRVALAAEHGFYYRWNDKYPWQESRPNADLSWIEVAHEIMLSYMERTDGSYIEKKTAGLVWHYKDADPEFGGWQASELHDHLESVLSSFGVQVISGNRWVQVRLRDVNKGVMVETILRWYSSGHLPPSPTGPLDEAPPPPPAASTSPSTPSGGGRAAMMAMPSPHRPDFILCCGDDRTDEDMFTYIDQVYERASEEVHSRIFTCVLGVKPSNARYYIRDSDEMVEILTALASASSSRPTRSSTVEDFRGPASALGEGNSSDGGGSGLRGHRLNVLGRASTSNDEAVGFHLAGTSLDDSDNRAGGRGRGSETRSDGISGSSLLRRH